MLVTENRPLCLHSIRTQNVSFLSVGRGFQAVDCGGYVFFDAKNTELVKHYTEKFGANLLGARIHQYRMEIDVDAAQELIERYTLEGDLNVR